jgi:hypothetical protein
MRLARLISAHPPCARPQVPPEQCVTLALQPSKKVRSAIQPGLPTVMRVSAADVRAAAAEAARAQQQSVTVPASGASARPLLLWLDAVPEVAGLEHELQGVMDWLTNEGHRCFTVMP